MVKVSRKSNKRFPEQSGRSMDIQSKQRSAEASCPPGWEVGRREEEPFVRCRGMVCSGRLLRTAKPLALGKIDSQEGRRHFLWPERPLGSETQKMPEPAAEGLRPPVSGSP